MYTESTDKPSPPSDIGKYVKVAVFVVLGLVVLLLAGNQLVVMLMNFTEFDEQFAKPLYYSLVSALILSSISLVRVNAVKRSSIFWYVLNSAIYLMSRAPGESKSIQGFGNFKLSPVQFAIWQISKVLLFGAFFVNVMFGFAAVSFFDGNQLGVENLPSLFTLPFVTPPTDPSYASDAVIPLIPSLVILLSPILAAIGLRLLLYVGLHGVISMITTYVADSTEGKARYLNYASTLELILGITVLWTAFNLFFTDNIDYNTRYIITGALLIGFALVAFSIVDRMRARILTHMFKRDVIIRIGTVLVIVLVVLAATLVNNSVADARKIEYIGPYTAQEIGVNRYLAELYSIQENTHDAQLLSVSSNNIAGYVEDNKDVLDVIRVWDWEAAFAKLKPEIGLIPYVDFEDNDILRFNDTLYWTASMAPILPSTVNPDNIWFNEHLVYTHVPNGFLTLGATDGQIVDSSTFFDQRSIYYGEGGLFQDTWSGYRVTRGEDTRELEGAFYAGDGGISISPPLSYIFEPNFLLSYPTESIHVNRYKDIHDRMETLYPYFLYSLFGAKIDLLPVTDGESTYWLVPLIIGFDTRDVPWSQGHPYLRLVGYALIDTYHGDISLLKTGDDFFTEMFVSQYHEKFEPMPEWLTNQIRYPVELFNWKTQMYNNYHVTNVETFIQANQFYEIPAGLETYYIQAKPPGFDQTEFLGLLSLELRGSQGRNLAGYMIVENDLPNLGRMQFYEVPLNSTTKLIGPTAVKEALDRDPEFAQLNTLLRNPRIGDNILYRVGDQDVYFIPVYTAGAGGVVAQLGTVAAVGASFTGEYYVGLGEDQESAFRAYLQKLSGATSTTNGGEIVEMTRDDRISALITVMEDRSIEVLEPTTIQFPLTFQEGEVFFYSASDQDDAISALESFIDDFVVPRTDRVFMWESDASINIGTVLVRDGIAEMHYVSIEVGS